MVSMYVVWIVMSYENFPHQIKPGGTYVNDGRTYEIPNLPHMVYGTEQEPSMDRPVPVLDLTLLKDLRQLIIDSFDTLRQAGVEFWVTGGSLISAVLWKSLMCYDDDCDIATRWENREYLWSPEFAKLLDMAGLETFYLRGASLEFATREMGAVRVRRKGTVIPTLDIFFVKEREDGTWSKVNTWNNGTLTFNPGEVWDDESWLFPIQEVDVDGMKWPVGNKPREMLDRQYGQGWDKFIKSPKALTNSHKWAFWFTNHAGAWRVGEVSSEDDPARLTLRAYQTKTDSKSSNEQSLGSA